MKPISSICWNCQQCSFEQPSVKWSTLFQVLAAILTRTNLATLTSFASKLTGDFDDASILHKKDASIVVAFTVPLLLDSALWKEVSTNTSLINLLVHTIRLLSEVRRERVLTYLPHREEDDQGDLRLHMRALHHCSGDGVVQRVSVSLLVKHWRIISLRFVAFAHRTSWKDQREFFGSLIASAPCVPNNQHFFVSLADGVK